MEVFIKQREYILTYYLSIPVNPLLYPLQSENNLKVKVITSKWHRKEIVEFL